MPSRDLDAFAGAYGEDFKFHQENLWMLSWYAERMINAVKQRQARSLISLGIGHTVVSRAIIEGLSGTLTKYTLIEGSTERIEAFKAAVPLPPNVTLVNSLFEEYDPPEEVDAVEMGFVLEHVDDPLRVLTRFVSCLRPGGLMVVVVPNARSLHRLFGHRAGLLPDLFQLSAQDHQLGHQRYFDLSSITELVTRAGLRIVASEGVFLKCLTTSQLDRLQLGPEVARSFFEVGVDYPEIANAIYLETTR